MTVVSRWIRRLAVPIILAWLLVVVALTLLVPQLEVVAARNAVSMSPSDAPSMQAMADMGRLFGESESDSIALVVLDADQPLGEDAHAYYDTLVDRLEADRAHVRNVQDTWGDPLTEAAAQSSDGRAAYVTLYLAGNMGETASNESVQAVRDIVGGLSPPPGVRVHVTGPAALTADVNIAGESSMARILAVTFAVIVVLLLFFYRSVTTVVLLLIMVGVQMSVARGVVAALGNAQIIGLSTFAVNLLVSLAVAAGTDYAIFLVGRYQEARASGADPLHAYDEMFRGTAHVVLGSGLTIAGAMFCLSFTRMPYFQSMGIPCAVGIVAGVAVALTLGPAIITVASRFGMLEPKRALRIRAWRRIGTTVVRWPGPILVASLALALIGLVALPGYQTSYDDTRYIPASIPANAGLQAATQHFSLSRMSPEVLIVEADHDLRNPSDFLILDRLAKRVFAVEGVARVQAPSRPDGAPIAHTSIPFLISMQGVGQQQNMKLMKDRIADMRTQADGIAKTIDTMKTMYGLMTRFSGITTEMIDDMAEMRDTVHQLRDMVANFDDQFRPIRNYFYWEPHCYDIPLCWSFRSLFDSMDGIGTMTDTFDKAVVNMDEMKTLLPQMLATFPPMIQTMESMRQMMLTTYATMGGFYDQMDELTRNSTEMGKAFDAARNDDSFYLPPEVFSNKDFQRAMESFFSPDGRTVRMLVAHRGNPTTEEALRRVEPIKIAAIEALKGTPLEDATIQLGGTAATFKDMSDGSRYDLMIAVVSALGLVLMIMLVLTRSLVAALVIVGTVTLSLGASFGISILIWQHIVGIELHWMVLALSIIALIAVGSDYNLLLVSRFKEEVGAGIRTGIIRAIGGTGSVVTVAGVVFALTMASMVVSDLRIMAQVGTTIGLGLLFDTFVVRAFMMPAIATLLGRWFWWPVPVRSRPARITTGPVSPRR
ncbi:MMPL family RND transporter [Mycolicibacterium chubuense]|uniref:Membrane transport protein mmpL8 n=1 Tax=Mycolicibacterium chubuense TaxID=1800 RepID=A0A0J6W591_MYCCU|nr:RND family transporter [Mycolicibacterium chubuense]KMO77634.1 Membrane transport protein mmpL8 [Mycolicibacterium chubuense]ORA54308.1 MMPL family RND transporter [Mycolicibacterium chubuense]